jgi:hypothetical protein
MGEYAEIGVETEFLLDQHGLCELFWLALGIGQDSRNTGSTGFPLSM